MQVKVRSLLYALMLSLCFLSAARAREPCRSATVQGAILDADTHAPVAGAEIYLLNTKICKIHGIKTTVRTAHGDYLLPHYQRAAYTAAADGAGAFALGNVAAPGPFKSYTVYIRAPGYAAFVIHNARVYPGRALAITVLLKKGALHATWFEGTDAGAPLAYAGEKAQR